MIEIICPKCFGNDISAFQKGEKDFVCDCGHEFSFEEAEWEESE